MTLQNGQNGDGGMVALSLEGRHPEDAVVEDGGARVFVGPDAASILGNSELDAQLDEQGRAAFTLNDQRA